MRVRRILLAVLLGTAVSTTAAAQTPAPTLSRPTTPASVPVADGFFYLGCGADGRPRAFRFYDYASRAARDIAPAPRSTSQGLTVAPNGRELLYTADALESGGDLVLLEFASGRP